MPDQNVLLPVSSPQDVVFYEKILARIDNLGDQLHSEISTLKAEVNLEFVELKKAVTRAATDYEVLAAKMAATEHEISKLVVVVLTGNGRHSLMTRVGSLEDNMANRRDEFNIFNARITEEIKQLREKGSMKSQSLAVQFDEERKQTATYRQGHRWFVGVMIAAVSAISTLIPLIVSLFHKP